MNPRLGFRYTRYSDTLTDDGLDGPALDRPVFEATVGVRGPTFSRVFTTPGFGYSPRLKHEIGPEFNWIYRTAVDEFDVIPKFDGIDHLLGTNQLSYGLVSARPGQAPGGKNGQAADPRAVPVARLPDVLRADQRGSERVRPELLGGGVRARRRPRPLLADQVTGPLHPDPAV